MFREIIALCSLNVMKYIVKLYWKMQRVLILKQWVNIINTVVKVLKHEVYLNNI
jgi:hypothetical protein